eukprot:6914794-Karenia_brevis.AAC.1
MASESNDAWPAVFVAIASESDDALPAAVVDCGKGPRCVDKPCKSACLALASKRGDAWHSFAQP